MEMIIEKINAIRSEADCGNKYEIKEWINGEGFDFFIEYNGCTSEKIGMSYSEFEDMKQMVEKLKGAE